MFVNEDPNANAESKSQYYKGVNKKYIFEPTSYEESVEKISTPQFPLMEHSNKLKTKKFKK